MSELWGLAGKNVIVTGGQGYGHMLTFAGVGCDSAVLDVARVVQGLAAFVPAGMMDATAKAVKERDVRYHQAPRITA